MFNIVVLWVKWWDLEKAIQHGLGLSSLQVRYFVESLCFDYKHFLRFSGFSFL